MVPFELCLSACKVILVIDVVASCGFFLPSPISSMLLCFMYFFEDQRQCTELSSEQDEPVLKSFFAVTAGENVPSVQGNVRKVN